MLRVYDIENKKLEKSLKKLYKNALKFLGQKYKKINCELSFCDKNEIKKLNNKFRSVNRITDVLSFPFEELEAGSIIKVEKIPVELGSIVICMEKAQKQAEEYNHSLNREISFLFLHGLLHLLGFDHEKEDEEKLMNETAQIILHINKITRND